MSNYVKSPNSDTWHWCKNCSNYPSSVGSTSSTKPTSGELCNQCQSKQKSGNCN